MNRILTLIAIALMSGCTMLQPPVETPDVVQGTTTVDAVEGDKSGDDSSGIIDTLRGRNDPVAGDPAWAPIHPKHEPEHYAAETGSLFNTGSKAGSVSLYNDSKPRGIGDIITVTMDESTKAAKSADADLSKNNAANMDPLEVGGKQLNVGDYNFSYNLKNDNKFTGSAAANQSNSISGSITVEVVEVLANGNLVIRGEKWLTLNTGDEYIRLSGTIRPDDISYDNTIASTRVSNARIRYSGTGTQQDMQEPGFLARFFNVSL
ncbi:flagellar basal body L-ring protein FlgH [Vibrio scophthalmi]|uniref:Flagellar L-ring protein n=1 Tax=Vibrio scophthalmi TaxID=45658 RepID=A0A1C7FB14_9VIBR|nr:flagellar basal body L-ring protein FlgH [Vibrio scophthalmi]ANU37126.1 Flagellar L-ring protein [Vibrio scophthalmi]